MAAYNTSSAYELQRQPKQQPKTNLHVHKSKKHNKHQAVAELIKPRTVFLFLLAVSAVLFLLYNQACLTEVNGEISSINRELKVLSSDNIRMQGILEPTESLRIVAEKAQQELGMQRLDKYQVEYVCIYEEDRVAMAEPQEPEGFAENIESFVASFAHSFNLLFE